MNCVSFKLLAKQIISGWGNDIATDRLTRTVSWLLNFPSTYSETQILGPMVAKQINKNKANQTKMGTCFE